MYGDDPKHFYMTLFNNETASLYPDNAIATFTDELARPIELDSNANWEVGVCEFAYPPNQVGSFWYRRSMWVRHWSTV